MSLNVLLLAAGFGTRLRPITNHLPKCLVPIHGKPLLGYWLDLLDSRQVNKIIINTHYLSDMVVDYVENHSLREKITLVHEDVLLGTAGTILKNRAKLLDGPFLLAHADNLTRFDVSSFVQSHSRRAKGIEMTMMTFETDVPESCGIVELDGDNRVIAFHEKVSSPPGNLANAAVYIIEPSVIDFIVSLNKEVIDFSTEVIPYYISKIQAFHNGDYHRDIGTEKSLALAEKELLR